MRTWIQIGLFLLVSMLSTEVVFAQKALMTCEKSVHQFGQIPEDGGNVSHTFEIKNEGTGPLVIVNVSATCGCTIPEWTKTPIAPGKTGTVKVTYNPTNRPGNFIKSVRVYGQGIRNGMVLTIRGSVVKAEDTTKEEGVSE